jgi:hypothetical protein
VYVIDAKNSGHTALSISEGRLGITLYGDGPDKTEIRLEGGHTHNQSGIVFEGNDNENHDGTVIRDLHLNGNGLNQQDDPGFGIRIEDGTQDVLIENCRINNWTTNGINANAGGWTARNCEFVDNGQGAKKIAGRLGHGVALKPPSGTSVLVERCYFANCSGTSVDMQRGNAGDLHLRQCVIDGTGYGAKKNPGTGEFHVDNCRFSNIPNQGIYYIPSSDDVGTIRINKTLFEDIDWPAIDMPAPATYKGSDIVMINCNAGDFRNGAWYDSRGATVDIGRLSVHDTRHGGALDFSETSGEINELIHGNNAAGIGDDANVSIRSTTSGSALSFDVPTASEVGVTSGTAVPDSPTYPTSDEYGQYNLPKAGQLDWHKPLNANFEAIGQEMQSLAERIEELEK